MKSLSCPKILLEVMSKENCTFSETDSRVKSLTKITALNKSQIRVCMQNKNKNKNIQLQSAYSFTVLHQDS